MKNLPGLLAFCLGALLVCGCSKGREYNVVLITIDALRPDHLGCYGYKRNTSPNIDRLAASGVLFKDCISQAAVTVPSIPSLMTSLYPHEHRVVTLDQDNTISGATLAGVLRSRGYATGLFVAHALSRSGIGKGFEVAHFDLGSGANELNTKALRWMDSVKGKKYFLFMHYLDTHAPYHAPREFEERFLNDGLYRTGKHIPISTDAAHPYDSRDSVPFYAAKDGIDSVDRYIALYDAAIRVTDNAVGQILEAVEANDAKYGTRTIVVVSADHAEYLGEHQIYFAHGHNLFDSVIKVPLVIFGPGIPQGKVIAGQVGLIDIMPTILDLLGVKSPGKISGVSLKPEIEGRRFDPERIIASEIWTDSADRSELAVLSLRTMEGKLLYSASDQYRQLIDLKENPQELRAPSAEDCKWSERLRVEFRRYLKAIPAYIGGERFEPDEKTKEGLRSLGYLN